MSKRKVLIVCGSLKTGGAEKLSQSIALHGDREEFEYHYLVFHQDPGIYEAALLPLGCRIHRLSEPRDNYIAFIHDLIHLLRRHDFQVVHGHTMFHCGILMLCAWMCRVPIRISHAHSSLLEKHNFLHRIYEAVMRLLIVCFSTDLVACSRSSGERLYGNRDFLLIPNGIDADLFAYSEKARKSVRSVLHLKDAFVIGHTGRMVSVKNQSFLLELMPELLQKCPNAVLLFLGDGEDRPLLEAKIRQLDLQSRVILAGNQADVAPYLSAMDVFVLPSLFEGMPLSLLEAQANGLPCVVSDSISAACFATARVHPLPLSAPPDSWIQTILSCNANKARTEPFLRDAAFNSKHTIAAIHEIYRKEYQND